MNYQECEQSFGHRDPPASRPNLRLRDASWPRSRKPSQLKSRRGRSLCLPAVVGLEDRTLLTISAFSQFANFTVGQDTGATPLATFTDSTASPVGSYAVTVDWGDGGATADTSAGTVTLTGGTYTVTGSHTYSTLGEYPVLVSVTETGNGNDTALVSMRDIVLGAPLTVTSVPFTPVKGVAPTNVEVATFVAAGTVAGAVSDYTATVTWGDGDSSAGVIAADGTVAGQFDVTATKPSAYAAAGADSVGVTVSDGGATPQAADTWVQIAASLPVARSGSASAMDDQGLIYVIGGYDGSALSAEVDQYDPSTGAWTTIAPLPVAATNTSAATGPDGLIYVLSDSALYAYNPAAGTWATLADAPAEHNTGALAVGSDGNIYAIGGSGTDGYTNEVDAYDIATDTWTTVASLPTERGFISATTGTDGRIYVAGGYDGTTTYSEVDAYDPASDTWNVVASLPTAGSSLPLGLGLDGLIYESELGVAYSIADNTWSAITASPSPTGQPAGLAGIDGRIYSIGGTDGTTYYSSVYAYEPVGPDTGSSTATVNVAPAISGLAAYTTFTVGQDSGAVTLATFTDATPSAAGNYTATIDWGDGGTTPDTSAGTVTLAGNLFTVTGSHTYSTRGEYPVSVSVQETGNGDDSVQVSSDDPVAGAALTVTAVPFSPVRGAAITNQEVATFSAAGTVVGSVSDYTATVTWGDGDTSSGVITAEGSVAGQFDVTASKPNPYATAGAETVVVTVSDGGASPQAANSWATIASVPTGRDLLASAVDAGGLIYAIGGSNGHDGRDRGGQLQPGHQPLVRRASPADSSSGDGGGDRRQRTDLRDRRDRCLWVHRERGGCLQPDGEYLGGRRELAGRSLGTDRGGRPRRDDLRHRRDCGIVGDQRGRRLRPGDRHLDRRRSHAHREHSGGRGGRPRRSHLRGRGLRRYESPERGGSLRCDREYLDRGRQPAQCTR